MNEIVGLGGFIPPDQIDKIVICADLAPVVERISGKLPPSKVWELFHNEPEARAGRIYFPYYRVDVAVIYARNLVWVTEQRQSIPEQFAENYQEASLLAFGALVWTEIGYQGLEHLASNRDSGSFVAFSSAFEHENNAQRAERILTKGAKLYEDCLRSFTTFRTKHGITSDCFTEYRLEYLLDPFRKEPVKERPGIAKL